MHAQKNTYHTNRNHTTTMEYMTQEGYDKIMAELQHMINVELPRVKDAIAEARAQGDLSENFEYHAAKREQGKLLSRISFKQKVLENARVLNTTQLNTEVVGLFRTVEITNLTANRQMTFTIVNPHEANLAEGKISVKSPIAEALMNHKVGETVDAHTPAGIMQLRIDSITL